METRRATAVFQATIARRGSDNVKISIRLLAAPPRDAAVLATPALTQQPQQPPFATTKVEGTDGVYIFRTAARRRSSSSRRTGHPTDPIGYARPEGVQDYVNEIKKSPTSRSATWSQPPSLRPIPRQALQDAGARVVAHKRAKERLDQLQNPLWCRSRGLRHTKTIELAAPTLELSYIGLQHSDSNIVMRLPREKDRLSSTRSRSGRCRAGGFIDMYPLEAEDFIKKVIAMDWERLIPGHTPASTAGSHQAGRARPAPPAGEASAEMKPLGCRQVLASEKDLKLST